MGAEGGGGWEQGAVSFDKPLEYACHWNAYA